MHSEFCYYASFQATYTEIKIYISAVPDILK